MTRLARNNMHNAQKTAGRAMTLSCHHKVAKGTVYYCFDDWFAGSRIHITQCMSCKQKEK